MERKRMKARSRRVKVPRRKSKAVVRIPPVPNQSWDLNAEQVELVKKSLCPGATDEELKFCLTVAKRNKLDPFRKQIHFVPRGRGQEKRWVPIVGIDGLRHIAARDHRDYGSVGEPEFGPMIEVKWTKEVNGKLVEKKLNVPEWARVLVTKKGCAEPTVGKVYWEEIYPNIDNAPLVRQMPRLMLAKCAEAQGQRKAYPSTDGLYIPEEFYAARPQYTPEGREITYGDEPKYVRKLVEDGPPVSELGRKQLEKVERLDKEFASSSTAAVGAQSSPASNVTQSGKVGVAAVTPATTAQPQGEGAKPSPGYSPPLKKPESPKHAGKLQERPRSLLNEITQSQPKNAPETTPSSAGVPRARIPHKITEVKKTREGKGVEVILDTGHRMYTFRNSAMDEKGTKLFDILLAKETVGKMAIFETKADAKGFWIIEKVIQIGDREWEDGVPVLRREPRMREPGEDSQKDLFFKP